MNLAAPLDHSLATRLVTDLVTTFGGEQAHVILDTILSKFTNVEKAALLHHWPTWARSKQLAPQWDWQSWGFLAGRMFGKTTAGSRFVNHEVAAGRAKSIGLSAPNETNSIAQQVTGASGLIATAPPWNKPRWVSSVNELHWPNGAVAYVRTPEVPDAIRGFDYDLAWLIELQSWPRATFEEAWKAYQFAIRIGDARTVWDATAKRGHKLLKRMLDDNKRDPNRFVVVRGSSFENSWNVKKGRIDALAADFGTNTRAGREELYGEMLDESEGALVKQVWIDENKRAEPERVSRRVIAVDPATTSRKGSDLTGISDCGLAQDGQLLVMRDMSGQYPPAKWAGIVLDAHRDGRCDCVVVERNAGGDFVVANLRAEAKDRGLLVVVLGEKERPKEVDGIVYVREVHSRGPKEDRASPLATAYERGRVSHIETADLSELEELLTGWIPETGQRSPDRLDALTLAATELLGFGSNKRDPKVAFEGFVDAARQVSRGAERGLPVLFGGTGRGNRI